MTSNNRRARIYKITTAGRKQLEQLTFHTRNLHLENASFANLKGVKSWRFSRMV